MAPQRCIAEYRRKILVGISDFGVLTFAPMGFIFRGRWSEVEQEPLRTR
ncbi:hypothetical protein WM42_1311 [Corynebacterium simulans]|nr:hypothetical protein WM42_1311 [Corynebacterium simulans]